MQEFDLKFPNDPLRIGRFTYVRFKKADSTSKPNM